MWGLFVGAAAAVLAPAGPGALVPLKLAIASADSVGSDVYVAVVVDFGNGSSMATVSKCVPVASNAKDSDALAAAVGSSNVAYAGSGLLCAIDTYPVNGVQNCGQSVGNGDFDYWSYWHGSSGQWVYANNGPAEQSVSSPADDVEGWKFQSDEPATSSDPPPSVAPSYAQICNASTEVPPAQGSSPAATTTTTTSEPAVTPTTAASTPGPAVAATTTTAVSTRSKSDSATTTTTTTGPAGRTTTTSTTGDPSGKGAGSHGSSATHRAAEASAASYRSKGGDSSSSLVPVILVAVVVAALGGFALFRWRRRPAEE
jgi:hypothetical protein